jgi:hypothetical protein
VRQCTTHKSALQKAKHRETREVIIGGVLGSITHPEDVIAGLHNTDAELVGVGRTVALRCADLAGEYNDRLLGWVVASAQSAPGPRLFDSSMRQYQ